MRLIDADKLLRLLDYDMYYTSIFIKRSIRDKEECNYLQLCGQRSTLTNCYDMVKNQPTAFNVDKVVSELKKEIKENPYQSEYLAGLYKAIEIIKAGGIDE